MNLKTKALMRQECLFTLYYDVLVYLFNFKALKHSLLYKVSIFHNAKRELIITDKLPFAIGLTPRR